jgi:hypothetical protein
MVPPNSTCKKSSKSTTGSNISSKYALQMLVSFLMAASVYFFEYRVMSTQVQRSLHQSMSILEIEDAVTDNAVRRLQYKTSDTNNHSIELEVLPMFNETGGLVVFLHTAKTGGTTVRNAFKEFPNVHVKRVMNEKELNQIRSKIDWYLSSDNTKDNMEGMERVMLLEIHGGHGEPMTIFQIHSYLQTWRVRAAANNKKVFMFTLLREPTPFYLSYFNFFKHPGCNWKWCDRPLVALTEENLVKTMVPNHQCQYLARKADKAENEALPVSRGECESVYNLLKTDADWVGTTETMHDTTLPLLSYMFSGNATTGRTVAIHNKQSSEDQLRVESLSTDTRRRIRDISIYDKYLYDSAVHDFSLDMWQNFAMA